MTDAEMKRVVLEIIFQFVGNAEEEYRNARLEAAAANARKQEADSDPDLCAGDWGGGLTRAVEAAAAELLRTETKRANWREIRDWANTQLVGPLCEGLRQDIKRSIRQF